MTDREKLKEAIGVLRTRRMADNTTLDLVLDAAESALAGPVMPEEPSEATLRAMECCDGNGVQYEYSRDLARAMYRATRNHLLSPPLRTKTIQVWRVEWATEVNKGWIPQSATEESEEAAETCADHLRKHGLKCIRVTGPHDQEVPA
ncbi:MAG: hypothetical protein ACOY4R_27480 [Pseudomonadota bacterium]